MTLGRVETTDATLGGRDDITTGAGFDVVLGGAAGDTVRSGDGTGIVLGDHGFVDWDDDGNASDVDAIWTTPTAPTAPPTSCTPARATTW